MSYPYFFADKNSITSDSVFIRGEDFNHLIRVLRARVGDIIEISDNETKRYRTVLAEIKKDEAVLQISQTVKIKEKPHRISLFMCLLKKEAMELAIQKTVEIGVDRIIPVLSARTVVEIESKKTKDKVSRWQQIALGASKQCKRDHICAITEPMDLGDIGMDGYDLFFLPVEDLNLDGGDGFAPKTEDTTGSLKDIAKALENMGSLYSGSSKNKNTAGCREDINILANTSTKNITKNPASNSSSDIAKNPASNSSSSDIAKSSANNGSGSDISKVPGSFSEIAYIVGPEGGFEKREVRDLVKKGAVPINFGTNILRAETASIYFISILDYLLKI